MQGLIPKNYRPISLLPRISKIIDIYFYFIFFQIEDYLNKEKLNTKEPFNRLLSGAVERLFLTGMNKQMHISRSSESI